MILIAPLMIPAAPVPEVARPAMNIGDDIAVAHIMDPTAVFNIDTLNRSLMEETYLAGYLMKRKIAT